ncbi:beta-lactamase [Cadophora sp. MPI-SDFR-AT-0126]|nr:beta-lactamase [Leotiomycetes sp. MPI-SDFR-AT-0126]
MGILALASASPGGADKAQGAIGSLNPARLRALNDAFSTAVNEKRVPGLSAIALDRDGNVLFKNSWGTTNMADPLAPPVTSSTEMEIASMTKAVTATAALQLIEAGRLDIDDLAEKHLPILQDLYVLDGFTPADQPTFHPLKTKPTIRHLMTHTSGFTYDFLNHNLKQWWQWRQKTGLPRQGSAPANLKTPLLYDSGAGYSYGASSDWLGFVVEEVSGLPLDIYFQKHIFQPLGLTNSGIINPDIALHHRLQNGTITADPLSAPPSSRPSPGSVAPLGGQFLTSTIDDYSTFLLTLINEGTHPRTGVSILRPSTVKNYLFTDLIPSAQWNIRSQNITARGDPIGTFISNNQALSNNGTFLAGLQKGWSAGFMTNNEDVPGGRRKGSGAWAGIGNLYYWLDPKDGKLGVVFTSLLPFFDVEMLQLFGKLEKEVYR